MNNPFNALRIIQTALILCIFIISAIIITSIQIWVNKKAGDYSSDMEDYDPTDIFNHINLVDFVLFLLVGFLIVRTAPTNYSYIKTKYSRFKAWAIILTPSFAAVGFSAFVYALSNIFLGIEATDIAIRISSMQAPLLEILPQVFPGYSSLALVVLTVMSITIVYNAIMAVVIAIWNTVRLAITDYYHFQNIEDYPMQLLLVYVISLVLLWVILGHAVNLIFDLFASIRYLAFSLVKAFL